MAILSALLPDRDAAVALLKYGGVGSLIAVFLVWFLADRVAADQQATLDAIRHHQQENREALRDQLHLLRVICVNLGQSDAERALCALSPDGPR